MAKWACEKLKILELVENSTHSVLGTVYLHMSSIVAVSGLIIMLAPVTLIFLMKAPLDVRVDTLDPDLTMKDTGLGVFMPECPRSSRIHINSRFLIK